LLWTVVPYPEQKPSRLVAADRGEDARQHERASYRIEEFRVGEPLRGIGALPVAALPIRAGESYVVRRGKRRPAICLSTGGDQVPIQLAQGRNRWQRQQAVLVAPYYGATPGSGRGGWPAEFVERIRHAEYPQYIWEELPIRGAEQSILWLAHLFAVGADPSNFEVEKWRLSDAALALLDEWLAWLFTGSLDPACVLGQIRQFWYPLSGQPPPPV
jgi:hypothetical protein